MKDKYAELVADKVEVVLPARFKILLKLMRACDETLLFFNKRKRLALFEDISSSVEAYTGRSFSITQFAQILTAVPKMYTHEWRKVNQNKTHSLVIDFPQQQKENDKKKEEENDSQKIDKRVNELKIALIKITEEHHKEFLNRIIAKRPNLKDYLSDYDPIKQGSWYHEFDPNDKRYVPNLAPTPLSEKQDPSAATTRGESVTDYLKRNRSTQKHESIGKFSLNSYVSIKKKEKAESSALGSKEADSTSKNELNIKRVEFPPKGPLLEKSENEGENSSFKTPLKLKQTQKVNSAGIPLDLLNKIKQKEAVIREEKEQAEEDLKANKHDYLKDRLFRLIDSIKSIYSVRRVSTLFMAKLMCELEDTQRGRYDDTDSAKKDLQHLLKASPRWIKAISLPNGTVVKIKSDYKKSNVKEDIEEYTKALDKDTENFS